MTGSPHGRMPPIVCLSETPGRREAADHAARSLGARRVEPAERGAQPPDSPGLVIAVTDDGIDLRRRDDLRRPVLRCDLLAIAQQPARRRLTARQPLVRAIGRRGAAVLDLTAGTGEDAARLAVFGCRVTAIERHPVVAMLLDDALARACRDDRWGEHFREHLRVKHADAFDVLRRITAGDRTAPDVIYIDPMFPARRRASALPPLSAQILRELVGDDEDAADLLGAARRSCRRVVVKRPDHAPPLADAPTAQFPGKTVRYDLYVDASAGAPGDDVG